MALEIGQIVEGKVTGLTKFGAFVELQDNKVGMVHISEVSNQFVKEISDFLEKGQQVKVKVMKIDEDGKISLSIKKALSEDEAQQTKPFPKKNNDKPQDKKNNNRSKPNVWTGPKKSATPDKELTFEEMMAKFKQESDDKLSDYKRATESKHGGFSRRGGNKRYN